MATANTASFFRKGFTVPKHHLKNNMAWDLRKNQFVGFAKVTDVLNRGTELFIHYEPSPVIPGIAEVIVPTRKMRSGDEKVPVTAPAPAVRITTSAPAVRKPKRKTGLGASSTSNHSSGEVKGGSYSSKQYQAGVLQAINKVANDKRLGGFVSSAEAKRQVEEALADMEKQVRSRIAVLKKSYVPPGYKSPVEVNQLLQSRKQGEISRPRGPVVPELTEEECQRRIDTAVKEALEKQNQGLKSTSIAQPRVSQDFIQIFIS